MPLYVNLWVKRHHLSDLFPVISSQPFGDPLCVDDGCTLYESLSKPPRHLKVTIHPCGRRKEFKKSLQIRDKSAVRNREYRNCSLVCDLIRCLCVQPSDKSQPRSTCHKPGLLPQRSDHMFLACRSCVVVISREAIASACSPQEKRGPKAPEVKFTDGHGIEHRRGDRGGINAIMRHSIL